MWGKTDEALRRRLKKGGKRGKKWRKRNPVGASISCPRKGENQGALGWSFGDKEDIIVDGETKGKEGKAGMEGECLDEGREKIGGERERPFLF